jgi:hypothetical protein
MQIRHRERPERGSATAETAVALPALVVVLALCLWVLGVAAATLRCAEAARAAARAAARGEPPSGVGDTAARTAGRPVTTTTTAHGDLLTVRVSWRVAAHVPLLGRLIPAFTVHQTATARIEPRAGPP